MAKARMLIVVNSRASGSQEDIEPALAVLGEAGFVLDVRWPKTVAELPALIKAAGSVSAVVVAGGDGTIHAALPSLIETRLRLGILPLGSANDLALTLDLPTDPADAARVITKGHARRIDIGLANGIPFINVASIGFAVQVTRRIDAERKRSLGRLSYAVAALEALGEAARFRAEIVCDGRRAAVNACQIAVGNGVHYGGGLVVADEAAIDDGVFDVYAIETASIPDLIALAPALRTGTHGDSPQVVTFRCRHLRIQTERSVDVSIDGEIATQTPVDFAVAPKALEVAAPLP